MENRKTYPFELKALPYAHSALEPIIDERTVGIHHDKHLQGYVNNLNAALEKHPKLHDLTLEELLTTILTVPKEDRTKIMNNAGGVYNHNVYFDTLGPAMNNRKPMGILAEAIIEGFGSYESMTELLASTSVGKFGSGWGWLATDKDGRLSITTTGNQDTVLEQGLTPLVAVDVWEHAYYLKYQNLRADYVKNLFGLINWEAVEEIYAGAVRNKKKLFGSKQV